MDKIKVIGGSPISGTVEPVANKNAVLKMIAAAILTTETVTLNNVPKTSDVRLMIKTFESLGGTVQYDKDKTIQLNSAKLTKTDIGSSTARASLVFLGPLLARFGQAHMLQILGCDLGIRQTDTHFDNFRKMGATISTDDKGMHLYLSDLKGTYIWQDETAVTPTENLIFLSVLAKGQTTIYNAACEPHIQDLCHMLCLMGAQINGIGSNKLEIQGVTSLHGVNFTPGNDHIDIGGLIAVAALTRGELLIKNAEVAHMQHILWTFQNLGVRVEVRGNDIFVPKDQELVINPSYKKNEIQASPWPKFPVDLLPVMVPLALACKGSIIIHNWMYESGLLFADELKKFGARVIIADPHRIITFGPTQFVGANVHSPYIIQAALAIFYTALAAKGESTLTGVSQIERRYENFFNIYQNLGAQFVTD